MQVGDVDHGETSGAGRGGLEETSEEAVAAGEGCDGWIIEIEDDEEDEIDAVEDNQDPEEPPVRLAGEQQRETSTWVVKQETKFLPNTTAFGYQLGVDPNGKTEHARESRVSDDN